MGKCVHTDKYMITFQNTTQFRYIYSTKLSAEGTKIRNSWSMSEQNLVNIRSEIVVPR